MKIIPRKIYIISAGMVSLILFLLAREVMNGEKVSLLLCIPFFLVSLVIGEIHRKITVISKKQNQNYKQIEALISVFSVITCNLPLPPMRDGAISPDMAALLISEIENNKPKVILECGSGVSTLIMAYCMEKTGNGHIWSLEHDKKYADIMKHTIESHQLSDKISLLYTPLKKIRLKDESWRWYETSFLEETGPIDLLFVDGPPESTGNLARYPALPLLINYMNLNAVVIIDDASRKDEQEMIKRWLEDYPDFQVETHNTEKGTVLLRRKA